MKDTRIPSWTPEEIDRVDLSVSGKKFDMYAQPSRPFDPYEVVYFVVKGIVDPKVSYERDTDDLWVRASSVQLSECFEVDTVTAKALLEDGRGDTASVLDGRRKGASAA